MTGIAHRQLDVAAGVDPQMDAGVLVAEPHVPGFDRHRAPVGHRVAGVDGEIQDDLDQLGPVGQDRAQRRRRLDVDLDVLADEAPQQAAGLAEHLAQIQDRGLHDLLSAEGEKLCGQRRGAVGRLADPGEVALLRGVRRQAGRHELGVVVDRGEDVVEVVGDPAGQLADGLELLRLAAALLDLQPWPGTTGPSSRREVPAPG